MSMEVGRNRLSDQSKFGHVVASCFYGVGNTIPLWSKFNLCCSTIGNFMNPVVF